MSQITKSIEALTAGRRAAYLFETKRAAKAVGCHHNKFNDWWLRTKRKLIALHIDQPGALAAELAAMIALAEDERQRQTIAPPPQ